MQRCVICSITGSKDTSQKQDEQVAEGKLATEQPLEFWRHQPKGMGYLHRAHAHPQSLCTECGSPK